MKDRVAAQSLRVLELEDVLEGVARHATWEGGKEAVLALRPFRDRDEVRQRQEEVLEAIHLDEGFTPPPLRGLRDVRAAVDEAARGQVLDPSSLLEVGQALLVALKVRQFFSDRYESVPRLTEMARLLTALPTHVQDVEACLDSDGTVRDAASPKLETLRVQIRTLQNRIQTKLQAVLRNSAFGKMFQEPFVTTRGERYVLPIKAEYRSQFPGIVLDASASGATLFMEPLSIIDPGNELREAQAGERHEVVQILTRLSERIGAVAPDIRANLELLAGLDLRMALARYAGETRGRIVPVEEKSLLILRKARHPLLDARAVPIDVTVGEGHRVLIVTGPNTGGKTVSLKTVGLMALMAMSGMPVPAGEGTRIGWIDGVFADIGDEQSIEQNLSTFSSHMTQVSRILEAAGPHSLVLLDEAGAGTDPREGTSLAVAILEALHARGTLVVTTTHYNELKAWAAQFEGAANAAMEFDAQTLQPTYHIRMGMPGRSCALEISERLGVPGEVLARAKELLGATHFTVEDLLTDIAAEREEALRHHQEAKRAREEAEKTSRGLQDTISKARGERESVLRSAREEAEGVVEAAREEARNLIRQARAEIALLKEDRFEKARELDRLDNRLKQDVKALGEIAGDVLDTLDRQTDVLPAAQLDEQPSAPADGDVEVGDLVRVPRLNQEGIVAEIRGDEAQVQMGRMRMAVPLRDLERRSRRQSRPRSGGTAGRHPQEAKESPSFDASTTRALQRTANVSTRLVLLGRRAEEAAWELERYLDDVASTGVNEVTVVHGKGTGVLQKVVHEVLRAHPAVASFRFGEPGEGGWGVTVVSLT